MLGYVDSFVIEAKYDFSTEGSWTELKTHLHLLFFLEKNSLAWAEAD